MLLKKSPQKICRIGKRNNRIVGTSLLNRSCVFDAHLESILLGVPPQNPFSTASTQLGRRPVGQTTLPLAIPGASKSAKLKLPSAVFRAGVGHEAARFHIDSRRRGRLAACSARAAAGD